MKQFLRLKVIPYLIYYFYKIYSKTIRYNEAPLPVKGRVIYAHFHQDELIIIPRRMNQHLCVMTSTSTDGEIITRFLTLMGYVCARGSATRGGAKALLEMIKLVNEQKLDVAMAVDGPRGPIYKVKPGVITLAKKTGLPILPVRIVPYNAFCFKKSWNKAFLPKPFSRVDIFFGEPVIVKLDCTEAEEEQLRAKVESEMMKLKCCPSAN